MLFERLSNNCLSIIVCVSLCSLVVNKPYFIIIRMYICKPCYVARSKPRHWRWGISNYEKKNRRVVILGLKHI
jgi:hypothetical protein